MTAHQQPQRPHVIVHPGVRWAELVEWSGESRIKIADRIGISRQQLHEILSCRALPSAKTTVHFAEFMGTSIVDLWQVRCNYELALALGINEGGNPPAAPAQGQVRAQMYPRRTRR